MCMKEYHPFPGGFHLRLQFIHGGKLLLRTDEMEKLNAYLPIIEISGIVQNEALHADAVFSADRRADADVGHCHVL